MTRPNLKPSTPLNIGRYYGTNPGTKVQTSRTARQGLGLESSNLTFASNASPTSEDRLPSTKLNKTLNSEAYNAYYTHSAASGGTSAAATANVLNNLGMSAEPLMGIA